HDQVQPIAQRVPITVSEKTAVKFKPQLSIESESASLSAVNVSW
ncbi:Necrosis inducing protein NPP1, partial [Phytophthora megakarya]